jgi:uncharacterized protein YyaL (SSP411 family)
MTQLRVRPAIAWLPWGASAFERARDEQKCVLLAIVASWSAACREMDDRCYGDAEIAAEINRWFVPVRVDADRRPDVMDRYELGGLPTTAFLDADGQILGGGTFVPPERLAEALRQVRRTPMSHASVAQFEAPGPSRSLTDEQLEAQVFSAFDHEHAGFGTAPKFPLVAPVRLALDRFRETGNGEIAEYATRTLDAMAWNGLYDEDAGGFCRCAAAADWSGPQREKLLATNASLLDLYLEAGVTLENERWLARAADTLAFVRDRLELSPGEGWRAAVDSDGARYGDSNAAMVSAALHASRVFADDGLRETALQSLESVVLSTYRPGQGVAHCAGGVRGLLTDHVAMATAHLDAWDLTGDVVYQMMAEELVQFMVRTMSARDGVFMDRWSTDTDDTLGLLTTRLKPFVANCDAAVLLHRLSHATNDAHWHRQALQTLAAVAPMASEQGPLAAHFLLARRSLAR